MNAMEDRDGQILEHIGRYRLTLRPVLDRLFFSADSTGCGNVLTRLISQGYVQARQVLPRRRCYYQLTRLGTMGRVPESRARLLRGQALRTWLGVLWYCCMHEGQRRLLEPRELDAILPTAPKGIHVAEAATGYRVLRVHVVGLKAKAGYVARKVHHDLRATAQDSTLAAWIRNRDYGFVILAERPRVRELVDRINRERLGESAYVAVVPVPGPHSVQKELSL